MLPISGSTTAGAGGAPKLRMFMSCSGCRALRKGCSDDCTIRPCLEWIKGPDAQANATSFLAKFYGRAGLLNLIAAAPDDADRPAVFRSLLHEACGRIVNPKFGAVGLLWSRQWHKCVEAVDAVLRGDLIVPLDVDPNPNPNPVVQAHAAAPLLIGACSRPGASSVAAAACYDIRHFAKDSDAAVAADLLGFARAAGRTGSKRAAGGSSSMSSRAKLLKGNASNSNNKRASSSLSLSSPDPEEELEPVPMMAMELEREGRGEEFALAGSQDHQLKGSKQNTDVEAAAASHVIIQAEAAEPPVGRQVLVADQVAEEEAGLGLELTLGFEPVPVVRQQPRSSSSGLQLQLPA